MSVPGPVPPWWRSAEVWSRRAPQLEPRRRRRRHRRGLSLPGVVVGRRGACEGKNRYYGQQPYADQPPGVVAPLDRPRLVGSLLPLLLLQDTFRFAFFAAGSPVRALWNDSIWSFGQFAGIGLVIGGGIDVGVATLIWIWAGAGALAGLLGIVQASIYPEMGGLYLWVKNHGDLGLRLALESVLSRGTRRLALYAVGAIAGLEALGSFSGARVLFGPMNVLYMGMFAFAIPEGVRVAEHSLRRMARAVNVASVALVGISLALGIGLLAMPERWAVDVLGAKWPEIRGLVVPLAIVVAASGWVNAHRVGFRVLSAAKQSLRVEMVTGPASIVAAIVGAAYGGAFGAAVGLAAVDLVSAAYWHLQFRSQIAQRALQSKRVS